MTDTAEVVRAVAADVVVVGYGNDLRSDDAAGRRAAERIEDRHLRGVHVLSVPQLAPEVAVDVARCGLAVFVDASVADREVTVRTVAPAARGRVLTHHATVPALLALVATLTDAPEAVQVSIPASDFAVGTTLSPATARATDDAVELIVETCRAHHAGLPRRTPGQAIRRPET